MAPCDRCMAEATVLFTGCPQCGPILLCQSCAELRTREVAEERQEGIIQ